MSYSIDHARRLSPRRNTTQSTTIEELVEEQLAHFGIDKQTAYGEALAATAKHLYHAQTDVTRLWEITEATLGELDREDKVAWFNAKKFLSFQLAKILDTLQ